MGEAWVNRSSTKQRKAQDKWRRHVAKHGGSISTGAVLPRSRYRAGVPVAEIEKARGGSREACMQSFNERSAVGKKRQEIAAPSRRNPAVRRLCLDSQSEERRAGEGKAGKENGSPGSRPGIGATRSVTRLSRGHRTASCRLSFASFFLTAQGSKSAAVVTSSLSHVRRSDDRERDTRKRKRKREREREQWRPRGPGATQARTYEHENDALWARSGRLCGCD